jgi:hypothetical protein
MADGGTLCPKCVNDNAKLIVDATVAQYDQQWEFLGVETNWEDPALQCDHC